MSSERFANNGRNGPPKPSTSNRSARPPLTPRLAGSASSAPIVPSLRRAPGPRSEPHKTNQRIKAKEDATPPGYAALTPHISSRSPLQSSRAESPQNNSQREDALSDKQSSSLSAAPHVAGGKGMTLGSSSRKSRPNSVVDDSGVKSPLPANLRPSGHTGSHWLQDDGELDSHFFRASDATKQDAGLKKVEPKRPAGFFYANGGKEDSPCQPRPAMLPSVSPNVAENKGQSLKTAGKESDSAAKSPPMLSPGLSALSNNSPFFSTPTPGDQKRSPSPSKGNIHLSYRKGASQIFGTRPLPLPRMDESNPIDVNTRQISITSVRTPHHKSPSLSSIDSGSSQLSRRRSATTVEITQSPSPLAQDPAAAPLPPVNFISPGHPKLPASLPSIDTSLDPSIQFSSPPPEGSLSPSKSAVGLANEARRERKVLDLEISNSSLLAINASLERELRRQKAELKRFRRLSRAGRLSSVLGNDARHPMFSDVDGEDGGLENDDLRRSSSIYDDVSEEDEASITSGAGSEPLSPGSTNKNRLEKDERRLHADLEKHKELLRQSQSMNQTLRRCMYATEDMIREGKKALQYHVRVSDVKLGGRILPHDDERHVDAEDRESIDVQDDLAEDDSTQQAKGFLDIWSGLGSGFEASEGGDRDSGIEVDKSHDTSSIASGTGDARLSLSQHDRNGSNEQTMLSTEYHQSAS